MLGTVPATSYNTLYTFHGCCNLIFQDIVITRAFSNKPLIDTPPSLSLHLPSCDVPGLFTFYFKVTTVSCHSYKYPCCPPSFVPFLISLFNLHCSTWFFLFCCLGFVSYSVVLQKTIFTLQFSIHPPLLRLFCLSLVQ